MNADLCDTHGLFGAATMEVIRAWFGTDEGQTPWQPGKGSAGFAGGSVGDGRVAVLARPHQPAIIWRPYNRECRR